MVKEKRVARLCWNDKGWIKPSGKKGKSVFSKSHEARFGYGHEEWLFDTGKLINGYHYGFLEPIRKQQHAYSNHIYNIWLYTIEGKTKDRYWVGEILNVEVIDAYESERIRNEYERRGWIQQMEEQVIEADANANGFSDWKGIDLFNIRFKPIDIRLNDEYVRLPSDHPVHEQPRYSFSRFKDSFHIKDDMSNTKFSFIVPTIISETKAYNFIDTGQHIREYKAVEITYLHRAISKGLTNKLREIYGDQNVTPEHPAGYGTARIDIVVNSPEGYLFYEVKTYPSLRVSIREAVGQLMEYSMWTDQDKAKKMIVVTQYHEDPKDASEYFRNIRDRYKIPLYYQSYDFENGTLSDLV
jgi:hypothetical protein